ncbi:MAG: TerB family tellurite resistance protein [Planctomycetes bacterium]|nr:TerB family tellurite resistance protein [Planctomycetota bacterium]
MAFPTPLVAKSPLPVLTLCGTSGQSIAGDTIMSTTEDLELLKAAIAVAMADGELRRSEKGVIEGLALRAGVGRTSFEAMVEAAARGDSIADNILISSKDRAHSALELLVAQARIDGQISSKEREVLVRIATSLKITGDEFQQLYEAGIRRADRLRRDRKT